MRERNYLGILKTRKVILLLILVVIFIVTAQFFSELVITVGALVFIALVVLRIIDWNYLFYAGIILMPVKNAGIINIGFHMQLSQLFLVSGIIFALLDKNSNLRYSPGRFDSKLILLLLVMVLSSFQSVYIPENPFVIFGALRNYPWIKGLTRIVFTAVMVFFVFFMRSYFSSKDKLYLLVKIMFLSTAVYSLIGVSAFFLSYIFGVHSISGFEFVVNNEGDIPRIRVLDWEPLNFGSYLLTITPVILLSFVSGTTSLFSRRILIVLASINVLAIFLTFSRSVWLGLFFSIICLCLLNFSDLSRESKRLFLRIKKTFFSNKQKYFSIAILAFAIFSVFVAGYLLLANSCFNFKDNLVSQQITGAIDTSSAKFWSTRLRLLTIGVAIESFVTHPFLGIGIENFNFYFGERYISATKAHAAENYPEVNSLPIKILAETGIFGFLILTVVLIKSVINVVLTLRSSRNSPDKTSVILLKGFFASIVGIGVQSLFFSNVYSTYLWALIGMFICSFELVDSAKKQN